MAVRQTVLYSASGPLFYTIQSIWLHRPIINNTQHSYNCSNPSSIIYNTIYIVPASYARPYDEMYQSCNQSLISQDIPHDPAHEYLSNQPCCSHPYQFLIKHVYQLLIPFLTSYHRVLWVKSINLLPTSLFPKHPYFHGIPEETEWKPLKSWTSSIFLVTYYLPPPRSLVPRPFESSGSCHEVLKQFVL